jgi:hypothetical protein
MRLALCVVEDKEQVCGNKVWAYTKTKRNIDPTRREGYETPGAKDKPARACNPVQTVLHETDNTSSAISTLCKTAQEGQRSGLGSHKEVRDSPVR